MNYSMPSGAAASAAQRVYEQLRKEIIDFELPPRSVLSRPELALRFGVSQTPVREALQMLEQDGLVRIFPQSKTVVRRIDLDQLHMFHFLRVAAECEVVRRLAQNHKPDLIPRVRAIVAMQSTLIDQVDQADLFKTLDRQFHSTLFDAAEVGPIESILSSRTGHLERCQRLDLPRKGKMGNIVASHTKIIDAIERGDVDGATDAMRFHLSGTISRIPDISAEYPDYFTDITPNS